MKRMFCASLMLLLCLISLCAYAEPLTVRFIDVGQGDSTLIQCDGYNMLIDTGPSGGLNSLRTQLTECQVEKIDYVVLTHPHDDHDANIRYLAEHYHIGQLWMPEYADDEEDYGSLLREMVGRGTRIIYPKVGDEHAVGDATVTVLSAGDPSFFTSNQNLWSIVLKVQYGANSVIVMGDAEDINEFAMIDSGEADLNADILRVGHHGSKTSTTEAFVDAVTPDVAISPVEKVTHTIILTTQRLTQCGTEECWFYGLTW